MFRMLEMYKQMHVNYEPRQVWENVVMTGSNCVHRLSDAIDDVTLGSDSDYVTRSLFRRFGVGLVLHSSVSLFFSQKNLDC